MFRQTQVEAVETRPADVILSRRAEAIVRAAKPRRNRIGVDAVGLAVKPGRLGLGILNLPDEVWAA